MTPILSILVFLMMVLIAKQKGFNPWLWVLAAGMVGLILLLFLPSARAAGLDEATRAKRRKIGNRVGGVLSGIVILIFVVLVVVFLV